MPTRVELSKYFRRELKQLTRKYPLTLQEVESLSIQLEANERSGDQLQGVGYETYKVRLKNPSAGKGKSGGFRVIYYVRIAEHVILLTIYSKSQQADISPEKIRQIIDEYLAQDTNENDE